MYEFDVIVDYLKDHRDLDVKFRVSEVGQEYLKYGFICYDSERCFQLDPQPAEKTYTLFYDEGKEGRHKIISSNLPGLALLASVFYEEREKLLHHYKPGVLNYEQIKEHPLYARNEMEDGKFYVGKMTPDPSDPFERYEIGIIRDGQKNYLDRRSDEKLALIKCAEFISVYPVFGKTYQELATDHMIGEDAMIPMLKVYLTGFSPFVKVSAEAAR